MIVTTSSQQNVSRSPHLIAMLVLLFSSAVHSTTLGQCIDVNGDVFTLNHADTIRFDARTLVPKEVDGYDSANYQLRQMNSSAYDFTNYRMWTQRYNPQVTVVPGAYIKGARDVIFSRAYYQNGTLAKGCTDTIKWFFAHPLDRRFDSVSTPRLTIGTGAGALMFGDFNKGLVTLKGWDYSLFHYSSLWISGLDVSGKPHFSGQFFYGNSRPYDSYAGPTHLSNAQARSSYEKVWNLSPSDLHSNFSSIDYPLDYLNGDNDREPWAPFVDKNGDGSFDDKDDYPCLLGDEMTFTSYHFAEDTTISFEQDYMPIDIKQHVFVMDDSAFSDVVFVRFEVINSSGESFDSVMIGLNSDMTTLPGTFRMGCDTSLNMFYSYADDSKKSYNPGNDVRPVAPSLGVVQLSHSMTNFLPFFKDFVDCSGGWPTGAQGYRNIMQTKSKAGKPYFKGESMCGGSSIGTVSKRLFPGNPLDSTTSGGWHMENDNTSRKQYSATGSHGPFQLGPQDTVVFDIALVVAYDGKRSRLENVKALKDKVSDVKSFYASNGFTCYDRNRLSSPETSRLSLEVYPNPSRNVVTIKSPQSAQLEVLDLTGKVVMVKALTEGTNSLLLNDLASGMYTLKFEQKGLVDFHKLLVQK